jgi:HSP20 family protein
MDIDLLNIWAKEDKTMAEVNVVKQPKPETVEWSRWFEPPLLRGGLFAMNPFALMKQFSEEMDRAFHGMPKAAGNGAEWAPAIEVKEKEGKLYVTAELAGLKPENVKVHVEGDILVVEGERKQEHEEKREGYYHSERSYGKFYRSIPLPEGAKAEETSANFHNGVLEVTIPLAEVKARRQEIPVKEAELKKAA